MPSINNNMIDDPKQVAALMQKLKTHLPIPAKATDELILTLRTNSINIPSNSLIEITNVIYMGDEGGICCAIKATGQEKEAAAVVSLTHLRFLNTHQLSSDVKAYQTLRTKKLAKLHRGLDGGYSRRF
jgi:hypothetical protein